jgi:hypothetical protein
MMRKPRSAAPGGQEASELPSARYALQAIFATEPNGRCL